MVLIVHLEPDFRLQTPESANLNKTNCARQPEQLFGHFNGLS